MGVSFTPSSQNILGLLNVCLELESRVDRQQSARNVPDMMFRPRSWGGTSRMICRTLENVVMIRGTNDSASALSRSSDGHGNEWLAV